MVTRFMSQYFNFWKTFSLRLPKLSPPSFSVSKTQLTLIRGISFLLVSVLFSFLTYSTLQQKLLTQLDQNLDFEVIQILLKNGKLEELSLANQSRIFSSLPEKSSRTPHFWWNETDPILVTITPNTTPLYFGNLRRVKNYQPPKSFKWIYLGQGYNGLKLSLKQISILNSPKTYLKTKQIIDPRALSF